MAAPNPIGPESDSDLQGAIIIRLTLSQVPSLKIVYPDLLRPAHYWPQILPNLAQRTTSAILSHMLANWVASPNQLKRVLVITLTNLVDLASKL
jgi:hypothetical protein